MPERIVYILGAGFSAPLGLPVMTNFVSKARDLAESAPDVGYLSDVLSEIDVLYKSTHFFHGDLGDIEEVLSLLHTRAVLTDASLKQRFARFVSTVVTRYTPDFSPFEGSTIASNWEVQIFGSDLLKRTYTGFAASLMGFRIVRQDPGPKALPIHYFTFKPRGSQSPQYCVVSLNYDQVLERALSVLQPYTAGPWAFRRERNFLASDRSIGGLLLKPHGSVDDDELLPPVWNKDLQPRHIATWKTVTQVLALATQIRIIGYSLPDSDTYIKYLLKVAVLGSSNLKKIDVICLDPDGRARERYNRFVTFRGYRFVTEDVTAYLSEIHRLRLRREGSQLNLDVIEAGHEQFFSMRTGA